MLGIALALYLLEKLVALAGFGAPDFVSVPVRLVLGAFFLWGLWRGFRWLVDRLLWRIRTKLIFSYLFIGLVPIVLLAILFATAGVLLLVLSGSRLVTVEVDRISDLSRSTALAAIVDLPASDAAAGTALRERLAPVRSLHPGASWTLLRGGQVAAAEGSAPRVVPGWWKGEPFASLIGGGAHEGPGPALLRVAVARGDSVLVLDLPADEHFFAALEQRAGIHVLQPRQMTARARARARAACAPAAAW